MIGPPNMPSQLRTIIQVALITFFIIWVVIGSWLSYHPKIPLSLASQFISPLIALFGISIAAFVAFKTWLSPFQPIVELRPVIWRLGPGNPASSPFAVVLYCTFFNKGAVSGVVSDLLLELELPKGKWLLEPLVFVKGGEFYRDLLKPQTETPFPPEHVDGPFTPIFLPGRTQVTKAVLFCRGLGKDDFNIDLLEPGQHPLHIFARYNLARELTRITAAKIAVESDVIAGWKAGVAQVGEVRHRDTQIKALPRK
jgi:hypothetical protein